MLLFLLTITGCGLDSDTDTNGDTVAALPDETVAPPGDPETTLVDQPSGTDPAVEAPALADHPGVIGSLQERAIECAATGAGACDLLAVDAAAIVFADAYTQLAATCGGRVAARLGCADLWGERPADGPGEPPPNGLGEFDDLALRCSKGEFDGCDDLALDVQARPTWDDYRLYGASCAGRRVETVEMTCVEVFGNTSGNQPTPSSTSMPYAGGDTQTELQEFADSCLAGTMVDCDELARAVGVLQLALADLTAFASTCGGRSSGTTGQSCQDIYGGKARSAPAVIDDIGRTEELDRLADGCSRGVLTQCDDLRLASPVGSGYMDFADSCGARRQPESAVCPQELLPPETTVPETTAPETTVPETTVLATTIPETTLPATTTIPVTTTVEATLAPETTVPATTVPGPIPPAPIDTNAAIAKALDGVGLGQIDIGSVVATSATGRSTVEVRVPFTDIPDEALRLLDLDPSLAAPYELVDVLDPRIVNQTLIFDLLVDSHDVNAGQVRMSGLDITYEGDKHAIPGPTKENWPWKLALAIAAPLAAAVGRILYKRWAPRRAKIVVTRPRRVTR